MRASEREGTHDLPQRLPGLSEQRAADLVDQVRENGVATFTYRGEPWELTPSTVEGSLAIWARPVLREESTRS